MAEHHAETRNRRAGRPTTPRRPGDRPYCAECLHDAALHGITPDGTITGTPADGATCRSIVIGSRTIQDHACNCTGYRPSPAARSPAAQADKG